MDGMGPGGCEQNRLKVFALLWACYCLRQARTCWGSDPDGTWGIFLERLQVILVTWRFQGGEGNGEWGELFFNTAMR